jgi:hypothetical protein
VKYQFNGALEALFPSRARRAILVALLGPQGAPASKSELARRSALTQRAISVEVEGLERAGLVRVEVVGTAHVLRPNESHPSTGPLRALLASARSGAKASIDSPAVRAALAALGAPLPEAPARPAPDPSSTLVAALGLVCRDAEVLRVLPALVARRASDLDWVRVAELARAAKRKAELGLVLDLAACLAAVPWLRDVATPLHDGRRRVLRFVPEAAADAERALASRHPQGVAERWGFRLNLREEDFRAALRACRPSPPPRSEPPIDFRAALEEALRALDASGAGPEEVTLLGDAALAFRHRSPPALPSLDVLPTLGPAARAALAPVVERHPFLASPPEDPPDEGLAPHAWRERRLRVAFPRLARTRVFLPEPHDWAILRAARALATDLDAVEAHHRREPLRLVILVSRYLEAVGGSPEAESRLRPGFLALVERLFGPAGRDRVLSGVPLEGSRGEPSPRRP